MLEINPEGFINGEIINASRTRAHDDIDGITFAHTTT